PPEPHSYSIELINTQDIPVQDISSIENNVSPLEVTQNIQSLLKEMHSLRQDFEAKVKYDESKERVIESLHRELLLHREGLHFRVLRPIFTDLVTLYDDMGKLIDGMFNSSSAIPDQVMQHLVIFQEAIEEILRRNGVEAFTMEEEIFLPNRQRNLRIIPTSDPAQDKHIARRVRQGFEYEGKLLRHEIVEVYKYMPTSNE
ncbi:MAG: nucleotide exchange factor GrpE, partial [Ktedonobacteraceae bacterium]